MEENSWPKERCSGWISAHRLLLVTLLLVRILNLPTAVAAYHIIMQSYCLYLWPAMMALHIQRCWLKMGLNLHIKCNITNRKDNMICNAFAFRADKRKFWFLNSQCKSNSNKPIYQLESIQNLIATGIVLRLSLIHIILKPFFSKS